MARHETPTTAHRNRAAAQRVRRYEPEPTASPYARRLADASKASYKVQGPVRFVWAGLRLSLGWVFLWAFLDKTFGLGYATARENAWIRGGSPTRGFLQFASDGPFAGFFKAMAGSAFVEWLFMLGLLAIGLALLLGVGVRIASYAGSLLLFMMWLAVFPKENNPFLDDHIVYILALLALGMVHAGRVLGLGNAWARTRLVQRFPWLE